MQIKAGQVLAAKESLSKLANLDLPLKTSYQISKFTKKFISEFEILERKRIDLIVKYGTEIENSKGSFIVNPDTTSPEKLEEYSKNIQELFGLNIEIEGERIPIKIIELENKDISLSSNDITNLEPFIDFKED